MTIRRRYAEPVLLPIALAMPYIAGALEVKIFLLLLSIVFEMKILVQLFEPEANREVLGRDLV